MGHYRGTDGPVANAPALLRSATNTLGIAILSVPLMLPPLVLAVALLVWYIFLNLKLGLSTVVLSHLLFALPFVASNYRIFQFTLVMVYSIALLGPITNPTDRTLCSAPNMRSRMIPAQRAPSAMGPR